MPLVKYEVPFVYYERASQVRFAAAAADANLGNANAIVVSPERDMLRRGIEINYLRYVNNSGSALTMALAGRLRTSDWVAGQVTSAGVYTDDTTAAQDETTGDFQMHDRTDDLSGFLVGASIPWNALGVIVSAAGDQTVTARLAEYWDGSNWVDLQSDLLIGDVTDNLLQVDGTGEKVQLWEVPNNWVLGGTPVATVPQDKYNMRFRLDTSAAGTADPTATQMFVGAARLPEVQLASGAGNAVQYNFDVPIRFPRQCEALFGLTDAVSIAAYVQVAQRFYW